MSLSIKWIELIGLRGFSKIGHIDLGIPNGKTGSGLTVIIGPNNSGKTTITEAFNALSKNRISFSEDKRNKLAQDRVEIYIMNNNNEKKGIQTIEPGSSEVEWIKENVEPLLTDIYVLPSRRTLNPFFPKDYMTRESYITSFGYSTIRPREINEFFRRLFSVIKNKETKRSFNDVLAKILNPLPDWTIDQSGHGDYFLKFRYDKIYHNSDGLGEGIISLFFIVDALYDSKENQIIVIDEPELSLHPSLQKKLAMLFSEYTKDRQIILATHSTNFINWDSIINGAKIIRTVRESEGIYIFHLREETVSRIDRLIKDINNPHILGQDAKEIFFLEDNVVLVEGQEDVIFYKKILNLLEMDINGEFFGWGVGGAGNMEAISKLLNDLGFKKVTGILDSGEERKYKELKRDFPDYRFFISPAEDVRTKEAKIGIIDENGNIRNEYKEGIRNIFLNINSYFQSS